MKDTVPDEIHRLFDRARRAADAVELTYADSHSTSAHFESNHLKYINTRSVRGVGLRVIHEGRIGHTSTTDFGDLNHLADRAIESSRFGQKARFAFPGSTGAPQVRLYDEAIDALTPERAVRIGREGIERVLAEFPDVDCSADVGWSTGCRALMNSTGLNLFERGTSFSKGLSCLQIHGESLVWTDEGDSARRFDPAMLPHADKVCSWLRLARREIQIGVEELPVIFTPKCLGLVLESFEANLNGKAEQKGVSLLAGREGETVADERITLCDDPLVDDATGSYRFDGEGLPGHAKALIERGRLRNLIYDLQTGGILGKSPTGNGLGGFASAPAPDFANLRLKAGETPYAQMIQSCERGLLVDGVLGAGQSNVLAGDFSVNLELGFLIEKGEIVGRVKNAMLAGNAFEAFRNVGRISRETEWHGDDEFPYVEFLGLVISGKEGRL